MPRSVLIVFSLSAVCVVAQQGEAPPVRTFTPHSASTTTIPAQQVDTPVIDTIQVSRPGDVTVHQDEKITELMKDFTLRKHPIKGYRVQIYLGNRKQAEEIRRDFLIRHSEIGAYLDWQQPNFKVRVGDLRTRLEAEKLRQELLAEFPGCYIVQDEIEMPRINGQ
jgi:hypothetical protein